MPRSFTVAICCRNEFVLGGLVRRLEGADHEVICQVSRVADLLPALAGSSPTIAIVDYESMDSSVNAIEALASQGCAVVFLANPSWDGQGIRTALKAGLKGCLSTHMCPESFLKSLDLITTDAVVISQDLGELVWQEQDAADSHHDIAELSPRQRHIAVQVAGGLSSQEIADKLSLSVHTVKVHIGNILTKLDLRNRSEIAAFAARNGWLDLIIKTKGKDELPPKADTEAARRGYSESGLN